ncbi:Trehalase [Blattella germanica]|nr:Trehalase [Blattella germanica]
MEGLRPTTRLLASGDIYCYGPLLHTVQMSNLYNDSKYFVDMKLKNPPNETMKAFLEFMRINNQKPNETEVQKFVDEMFESPDTEFEQWKPKDWTSNPKFLSNIKDPFYQKWAQDLNHFWKQLGRKLRDDIQEHQELYSIIYVPNPVIVPGGRFREFYYWDSYWIVQGLLLSEMNVTVKGMLENFLHMVKTYGFIPNGGRVYYLRRSQPPLLIPTVKTYVDKTNDTEFLKENIDLLEAEFMFWMKNHTVTVEKENKNYTLARYYAPSAGPRPESYKEDYKHTEILKTPEEKQYQYIQLKTAAESGWDFSTRWFIVNGTNKGHITDTKTQHIIPVELNAILQWNARILSEFYDKLGNSAKAAQYKHLADEWLEAVTNVLWNEEIGAWLDYDTLNNIPRNYFYPTNLSPLWTGCYRKEDFRVGKIMKYLQNVDILRNLGGIPSSMEHSGEQWDFPNAWPPLQYIVIMALDNTNDPWAQDLAYELAERWVRSNFKAYNESQAMYEKYDATIPGGYGGGGEYVNQVGFGWTNGVILELLDKYGSHLSVRDSFFSERHKYDIAQDSSAHGLQCSIVLLLITLCGGIFVH